MPGCVAVKPNFRRSRCPRRLPRPRRFKSVSCCFPRVTQLDFTGPLQVFSSVPGAKVHLIWKRIEPVTERFRAGADADHRPLRIARSSTSSACPAGSAPTTWSMTRRCWPSCASRRAGAKYITSVCTGSLVLGAAGLLKGYRAATHWTAMDFLSAFGAIPTKTRVCVDRNRVTGGGVTAGIDFALTLVSLLRRPADRGGDPAPARIQSRRRRSTPARPTPRRRKSSPS